METRQRRRRVRMKWLKAVTLVNNPPLILERIEHLYRRRADRALTAVSGPPALHDVQVKIDVNVNVYNIWSRLHIFAASNDDDTEVPGCHGDHSMLSKLVSFLIVIGRLFQICGTATRTTRAAVTVFVDGTINRALFEDRRD